MKDQESFDKLPPVPGVLSFREDNDKLYVNGRNGWEAVVNKNEVRIIHIGTSIATQLKTCKLQQVS